MTILLNSPLKPDLIKLTKYLEQVNECGWYTNFGPLHQLLTKRLEKYLGVKNLLLVSNGTLAIQVACKALNVRSAITTPFSFVATTSSLLWQGIETAFCDIDLLNYNLCPLLLDKSLTEDDHYDGIVATHVYGNPCDVEGVANVATKFNKKVIYDAAHAFGVKVDDQSVLNFGDASTLSFHATKVFHTVEGGAIVFKHKADYERAKRLINFGIDTLGNITEAGINAKLNEYQCAVGLTILDDIEKTIVHRVKLFNTYREGLKGVVDMPIWHPQANSNGAYMPIKLADVEERILIQRVLKENNVQCRQYFSPSLEKVFNLQKVFSNKNSNNVTQEILCLPLHFYMSTHDVEKIIQIISIALNGVNND
jgi:dTDP-4-amino-4,6-dideoxygalactose transaminase